MVRRRGASVAHALGWCGAVGLAAVVAARLWRSESVPVLIGVQGVTPWVLLGAYPLAGLALWLRRPPLLLAALSLGAVQVVLTVTTIGWHGSQDLPGGRTALRVVSANVLLDNPRLPGLAADIAEDDADVVLLQEVTPELLQQLRTTDLWAAYEHRAVDPRPRFHGAVTLSRYPLVEKGVVDVNGSPMLVVDMQTPQGRVRVVNVHTVAPLTRADARTWAGQFTGLAQLLDRSPFPVILAGDFNATEAHAPLDGLLESGGVRDAFDVVGAGLGSTWPHWMPGVPALMRLDHVLVTDDLAVASLSTEVSDGSDHLRLVAVLGLPPARE